MHSDKLPKHQTSVFVNKNYWKFSINKHVDVFILCHTYESNTKIL